MAMFALSVTVCDIITFELTNVLESKMKIKDVNLKMKVKRVDDLDENGLLHLHGQHVCVRQNWCL